MVVMVAEERADAEGDLVMAAEKVTPDHVNFMAREARGVVSIAITRQADARDSEFRWSTCPGRRLA